MQNREKTPGNISTGDRRTNIPLPVSPSERRGFLSSRRNFMAATTLGLASLGAVSGQLYADNPLIIPKIGMELVFDQNCADIPDSSKETVILDFESPNTARMNRILKRAERAIGRGSEEGVRKVVAQIDEYRSDMAEKFGFTLHDPSQALDLINASDSNTDTLNAVQGYFEGFGISLSAQRDFIKDMAITGVPISFDQLPQDVFKMVSENLVTSFSRYPQELVHLANIRRIVLWDSIFDGEVAGGTNKFNSTMHLPLAALVTPELSSNIANHEMGHALDVTVCGSIGATRDSEYTDLNSEGTSYGVKSNSTDFMYPYGGVSVEEDKATVYEFMLDVIKDPAGLSPVIQAKQRLLLARLEANIPGISGYLRAVSNFKPVSES